MADGEIAPPRNRLLKPALIVVSVLAALALLPAILAGVMSPMMADSGSSPAVVAFIIVMVSFPLGLVALPVLAWISYSRKQDRRAWLLMALLAVWPIALVVVSGALDAAN